MKKIITALLAFALLISLAACGSAAQTSSQPSSANQASGSDGASKLTGIVAFCSDVGSIDDESFNQFSYAGVQDAAKKYGLPCNYYIPSVDSTEERETNIRKAIDDGAKVIVTCGYLYGDALAWAAEQYPDVDFISIEATQEDIKNTYDNIYSISYEYAQAGYLAGYAVVMDGYTKLGFLGGMAVPGVVGYGYGYIQGADAAAQELKTKVSMNYWYGGQFYGDANITAKMDGWYSNGTQIIFSCGGGIYTSVVEAALNRNGKIVGVDVDQNHIGANGVADGKYKFNPFVTSAMCGLELSVSDALDNYFTGNWSKVGGQYVTLGLKDGDYVGLPTEKTSWNFKTFSMDQYNTVVAKIKSGEITVNNSTDDLIKPKTSEYLSVTYLK